MEGLETMMEGVGEGYLEDWPLNKCGDGALREEVDALKAAVL